MNTQTITMATHQLNHPNIFKTCPVQQPSHHLPLTHHLFAKSISGEGSHYDVISFDPHCPTMKDKLDNGARKTCSKYW